MSLEHVSYCAGCANIDRRQFLSAAALAAIAAMLTACGGDNSTAPTLSGSGTINVNDYPPLATTGGVALVTVNGAPLAIVRTGATSFLALSRRCPHQGTTVNTASGGGFLCPNHGARFDANGTWIGGERTSNMTSYPTSYSASTGVLTIN
jgi:Rieske Fe-S protein